MGKAVSIPPCRVDGCNLPVDIILKSSDNKKIGTHSKNLAAFSEGFPPAEWITPNPAEDIVTLSEKEKVLVLLMGFMHNSTPPDLEDGSVVTLDDLLELYVATKKYISLLGLHACRLALRQRLPTITPEEALKVLRYKVSHEDTSDIDPFARKTVNIPMKTVWESLAGYPQLFYAWARYQIAWVEWRSEYETAMNHNSYDVVHKDARVCHELDNYLIVLRCGLPEPPYELNMTDVDATVSLINKLPIPLKTICGCGAFRKWKDGMARVFSTQPKWSDFAG